MIKDELEALKKRLEKSLPNGEWQKILAVLDIAGIADNRHLQSATGLGRDKLRRTLEKMTDAKAGLPPLFSISSEKLLRPGLQGRAPNVYLLGKSGATLRRHLGHQDARSYAQQSPIAQAHALALLDIHLAAEEAKLAVKTERRLYATEKVYIRPDCLVTLASGQQAFFEIEQLARPDYLPRMTRSLRQKIEFYTHNEADVSSDVRVLFNLKPGATYRKTLERWRGICALLVQEREKPLPFRLLAMPLMDFLATPDWSEQPDMSCWLDLSTKQPASSPSSSKEVGGTARAETLPASLMQLSSLQNLLILKALWQEFREQDVQIKEDFVFPDPQFFELVQLIYFASHNPQGTALERAAFPNASLYLLRQYLLMRPALTNTISNVMTNGGWSVHWNATTILNRMQSVVDAFLAYHGFRSNGALKAFAQIVDWTADQPKSFTVSVKITSPELLTDDVENYFPRRDEIEYAEKALTWILRSLFVHAKKLGLRPPRFW